MIGKKLRLSKIINPKTNRTCIVPMDHPITLGPVEGLENLLGTIKATVNGGADAIVLHKGMFNKIAGYPEITSKCSFILHLSASTNLSRDDNDKRLVSTVEQGVKLGAAGISIHVNLGCDYEGKMLEDMGMVSDQCMEWGMPLFAMMYARGRNLDSFDVANIAHAAKVAEELGADIIKINSPASPKDLDKVVQRINTPIVVAGGSKTSIKELLLYVNEVMKAGASGVSIGRNVFQSSDPEAVTRIIYEMVHNNLQYNDAVNKIPKELL